MINDSVEKVNAGGSLVNEAGKTMAEIVTSVKQVTDIISEIAAASQEQSEGIQFGRGRIFCVTLRGSG